MDAELKPDTLAEIITANCNRLPPDGGRFKRHRLIKHSNEVQTQEYQWNRVEILRDNARLYAQNKGNYRHRSDIAGGYPMRIPEIDIACLKRAYPLARGEGTRQEIKKFWIAVYRRFPEYRIG